MESVISYINNFRKNNPTGWKRWLFGGVFTLAALLILWFLLYREATLGWLLAKFKHERDVHAEEAKKERLDADLQALEHIRRTVLDNAQRHEDAARRLETSISGLEENRRRYGALIDSLTSWEDVDAKVR